MSKPLNIPLWQKAPTIRLLIPFSVGIILQWYLPAPVLWIVVALAFITLVFFLFSLLPTVEKFKLPSLQGSLLHLLLIIVGMLVTWNKDVRHRNHWYGNYYKEGDYVAAVIKEPLVEKTKSYKADAYIEQLIRKDSAIAAEGKLLLYFSKDSITPELNYGDKILINKKLIPIKNSGNPGAFNYQRYASFQQTFHNVFLKPGDWIKLKGNKANAFQNFLFEAREKILFALQKNISNGDPNFYRDELGIAEALLIGYTNDLDKDLVQAYSNTGVVHIIAISGMHLGLIYGMLLWLFAKTPVIRQSKTTQAIFIVSCLWLFSLLTGGAASVIRSAVMFTFITAGKMLLKKETSIYSSLAASALVMLVINPYYLWDVGFQLSYLAVVGIVVFQKPIYNCIYIKNAFIDKIWKAAALTSAAQILTFPICIYYFHQFPVLFLFTNLVAVPLSTIILYAAILLVGFSWIPMAGVYLGKITGWLLWLMNKIILWVNELPFAVWDKIPSNIITTWLLYATVVFVALWLLNKNVLSLQRALASLSIFLFIHTITSWQVKNQQKFIVYNVPQHQAIDFVEGTNYCFVGDSILLVDGILQNFHLKPGRIALQLNKKVDTMPSCFTKNGFYQFGNKKIVVLDEDVSFETTEKLVVDYIVISKSPKVYINQLVKTFNCSKFIFDASNSLWKIEKWKQDCDKLNLSYHSIPELGAFVADL